jgi:hypothetical protein
VLLGVEIPNELPYNDFFEYYAPDFKLHLTASDMPNNNKREALEGITTRILQNLKNLQGAPSVQMQAVPPDWVVRNQMSVQEIEDKFPDKTPQALTKDGATKREAENEYFDGDKDNDRIDLSGDQFPGKTGKRSYLNQTQAPEGSAKDAAAESGNDAAVVAAMEVD